MTLLSKYISDNKIDLNVFNDKTKVDGTNEFIFFKFIIKSAIYISSKIDVKFAIYIVRLYDNNEEYINDIINIKGNNSIVTVKLKGKEYKSANNNELEEIWEGNNKKKFYEYYISYPYNDNFLINISEKKIEKEYREIIGKRQEILVKALKPICSYIDKIKFRLRNFKLKGNDKEKFDQQMYAKLYAKPLMIFAPNNDIDKNIIKVDTAYFPAGLKINAIDELIPYYYFSILGVNLFLAAYVSTDQYKNLSLINNDTNKIYQLYAKAESGGSARLNTSIIEYLITGIPIDDEKNNLVDIKKRVLALLNGFKKVITIKPSDRCINCDNDVIVYHGSLNPIHQDNEFKLLAFLSTTVSWSVAESYAKDKGYIYIIRIKKGFPFLHVNDYKNYQILLPIGTHIVVRPKKYNVEGKKIIICDLLSDLSVKNIDDIGNIFGHTPSFPKLKLFDNFTYFKKVSEYKNVNSIKMTVGSSVFHTGEYKGNKYYIKSITKSSNTQRSDRGNYYIIKRIINELLASMIYNFYGLQTLSYNIVINNTNIKNMDNYCLSSKIIDNIDYKLAFDLTNSKKILQGFLVDCILSNWDVKNNNNIGSLNNEIIRTDVGGALVYRGRGDIKVEFYNSFNKPTEHRTFINQESGTNRYFFSKHFDTLKTAKVNSDLLIYDIIKNLDVVGIKTYQPILDLKSDMLGFGLGSQFCEFIDKILDIVITRHIYYFDMYSKKAKISKIIYNKKFYNLKSDKLGDKYFVTKGEKIYLKDIDGLYQYQVTGGTTNEVVESSSISVSPSVFNQIIKDRLKN